MGKMSLWKPKKGKDYAFFDKTISEMFRMGSSDMYVHKYLGPIDQGPSTDATQPQYPTQSVTNIQDVLFLENRDRKYDPDVYVLRGAYQRSDNDFDLTQFGIFLQTGTVIMTFHHNDMIDALGRRIMNGDVIEVAHLKDDFALDTATALKRFYVAGDCSWATEGFSPTWYPHLWRVKINPLVDSQEYKDILNNITATNSSGPMGTSVPPGGTPLADIMSTYNKYIGINEAIVQQAETDVPVSGYDVSKIFTPLVDVNGDPAIEAGSTDDIRDTADSDIIDSSSATFSPTPELNPKGYLSGDGLAPDGLAVTAGVAFPVGANQGDYYLRLDYLPNRLFRFDGRRWVKMEDNVRTNLTPGGTGNETWKNSFVNNANTMTLSNGDTIPERQNLNEALRPKADL